MKKTSLELLAVVSVRLAQSDSIPPPTVLTTVVTQSDDVSCQPFCSSFFSVDKLN